MRFFLLTSIFVSLPNVCLGQDYEVISFLDVRRENGVSSYYVRLKIYGSGIPDEDGVKGAFDVNLGNPGLDTTKK